MPRQDTVDFLTAFAVGTVLGIGATLLLQPQRTPRERVLRQIKPYKKQMRRSYAQAREAVRDGRSATGDLTSEVISAGRELLGEFRSEMSDIVSDTREEIQKMVSDQVKDLSHGAKRTRRKMGM